MSTATFSIIESGIRGTLIEVECHLSNGLPALVIVGSVSKAVDESRERLRGAFASSGLVMPKKRITINIAPGDLPKHGAGIDVAIAVSVLTVSGQCQPSTEKAVYIGELGLDGTVRSVRGIIGKILAAKQHGITNVYIPEANLSQANLVENIVIYPLKSLSQLYRHMTGIELIKPYKDSSAVSIDTPRRIVPVDMSEVSGQFQAKRALEIAAAGNHNLLMNGPPGTGKSMLAKAVTGILPPMNADEVIEATQLHSLASKDYESTISERPFRAPHHTASNISIIGGGQHPKPGEISLSHRGVLFLDEILEFNRATIESLRQPLEDHKISVDRAAGNIVYPARFMLIATSNPCPCGYYGSRRTCDCLPYQIAKYQHKLSGPIIDRIDMYVDVEEVDHTRLLHTNATETSSTVRERVCAAREKQYTRLGGRTRTNGDMTNKEIKTLAQLSAQAENLLNKAAQSLQLSPRAYMRCIKVARTIADLADSDKIETEHISEALQFRRREQAFL